MLRLDRFRASLGRVIGTLRQRMLRHALYLRFITLLACTAILAVMMQAGSLFLLDYIPASQSAMQQVAQRKLEWARFLDNPSQDRQPAPWNVHTLTGGENPHGWYAGHLSGKLAKLVEDVREQERTYHLGNAARDEWQPQRMLDSHDALLDGLRRDAEEKQAVLVMLQLMGLLLLLCCLGAMALLIRQVLIDRIAGLVALLPNQALSQQDRRDLDELSQLESLVQEFSAQMQGFKAETEWFNRTRSDLLRRMLRAHTFLHDLVVAFNDSVVNESSLKTMIYAMESSLDLRNVALHFMLDGGEAGGERLLFSQHAPGALPEGVSRDLAVKRSAKFLVADGAECIAATFACPGDNSGTLLLEAKPGQEFHESDITLAEITAQLLSLVLGAQSREEQARRLALFEERAAIARELHDSLAQSLAYMKIQIARLQTQGSGGQHDTNEITTELREGLDTAYRELRELLSTFRMHMDVRGLGFAIQAAIDEFSHRSSVSITLDNRLVNCRLTVNEEFHILHVIREALSNIIRHAGAKNVVVALAYTPGSTVVVTIDDDGVGIPATATDEPGHYGQSIMRDRAYSLGGDITISARRQGGTRVRLIFTPKLNQ
ncbi:histidine kinase [Methylobacillus flagellatus]|uniref:histidine kinase n=1 Tax=Methylobacillus flagellatus (strain ATCC 51484 / DSM 6875 / VKM B-1610 / KT) TaxID=265072 RepID=Q1H473_METFK|nr:histidine kinase [Methylobacillus flagellatus]ABE48714.1 signal transduction histidine kinase, nitrate/nitrite-specific, NarQ [Methylobacillus flagellatus KT]